MPRAREMTAGRYAGTARQDTGGGRNECRQQDRRQYEADPHRRGGGRQGETCQQREHAGRCGHRSPQIVEDLPTADRRDGSACPIGAGFRSATRQPRQQLPIAARPAVVAPRIEVVAGGKLLDHFDIRHSSRIGGVCDAAPVADQRVGRKGLHYNGRLGTLAVAIRGGGCGGNWSLSCWIRSLSSGSGWV